MIWYVFMSNDDIFNNWIMRRVITLGAIFVHHIGGRIWIYSEKKLELRRGSESITSSVHLFLSAPLCLDARPCLGMLTWIPIDECQPTTMPPTIQHIVTISMRCAPIPKCWYAKWLFYIKLHVYIFILPLRLIKWSNDAPMLTDSQFCRMHPLCGNRQVWLIK